MRYATVSRAAAAIFEYRGTVLICAVRAAACVAALVIWQMPVVTPLLLLTVLTTSALLSYRNPFGTDGSDQMAIILFCGLFVYSVADSQIMRDVALYFIGAQAVLSYVVAGIAKAISADWRRGRALKAILNTRTYGSALAARALGAVPDRANISLCWTIIIVESCFWMVLMLPPVPASLFLAWGFGFHLSNAALMGLNTFFWAFVAAYPCILFFNHLISSLLY